MDNVVHAPNRKGRTNEIDRPACALAFADELGERVVAMASRRTYELLQLG